MNSITKKVKKMRLFVVYGGKCAICKKSLNMKSATLEHIIPKCRGGSDRLINLAITCLDCNQRKGDSVVYIERKGKVLR